MPTATAFCRTSEHIPPVSWLSRYHISSSCTRSTVTQLAPGKRGYTHLLIFGGLPAFYGSHTLPLVPLLYYRRPDISGRFLAFLAVQHSPWSFNFSAQDTTFQRFLWLGQGRHQCTSKSGSLRDRLILGFQSFGASGLWSSKDIWDLFLFIRLSGLPAKGTGRCRMGLPLLDSTLLLLIIPPADSQASVLDLLFYPASVCARHTPCREALASFLSAFCSRGTTIPQSNTFVI